ncbi:MAG: hypothetical protein WDZ77_00055 [Candidatus Pacearchaeota archaeon]
MEKTDNDFKERKLSNLVGRINKFGNGNRARHLVRVLNKAYDSGNLNIDVLRKDSFEGIGASLSGISHTIDYLNSEDKESFTFDQDSGGWGLYEKLTSGIHSGDSALHFAIIGGDAEVSGEDSGWYGIFKDKAQASGVGSGWNGIFKDKSKRI